MQEPLRKELTAGVEVLKQDVEKFDIDFELSGPMVEGIPAKEASERYNFALVYLIIFYKLANAHEIS